MRICVRQIKEKTKGGYIEISFVDPKAAKADAMEENEIEIENEVAIENEVVEEITSASEESDQIPTGNFPKMLAIIEDALNRNYNLSDIAILVRKNDDEVKVADYLLHETNIDFISGNSLKITANNKVRFIISCLRFLYDTKIKS